MSRFLFAISLALTAILPAFADDAAIDDLAAKLKSSDLQARRDAAYELASHGAAAKPALKELIAALDDRDEKVYAQSMKAIAAIGPDAAEVVPVRVRYL